MKLWGQVDLKPVLVTILGGAVLSGGGFLISKALKVDVLEARMGRIEDAQEIILNRLPPVVPASPVLPPKQAKHRDP